MFGFLKSDSDSRPAVELVGAQVYLRSPQASDWRAWAELRAASRAFLEPWEPRWAEGALTRAAFSRRLRRQARESRDDAGYSFFILRRDDDALVGGINLSNVQRGVAMSCSISYWIGMEYARQGLMGDALEALLPFVFKKLSLHRLEAACLATNLASEGLLRNLGFQREGYAQDYLLFALLADDFSRNVQLGWYKNLIKYLCQMRV